MKSGPMGLRAIESPRPSLDSQNDSPLIIDTRTERTCQCRHTIVVRAKGYCSKLAGDGELVGCAVVRL